MDLRETNKGILAKCPIHFGDDENCKIYTGENFEYASWRCWSRGCHTSVGKSLINLISALLARTNPGITFYETIDWLIQQYGIDANSPLPPPKPPKPLPTEPSFNFGTPEFPAGGVGLTPDAFRDLFECPSPYFQSRGLSADLLVRHAIGDCYDPGHQMYQRACVPFLNPAGDKVIGIQGRSLYDKCLVCRQFHSGLCFQKNSEYSPKWENSTGFQLHAYFYPYWSNAHIIRSLKSAILVEGVMDSLSLEAAGLRNSLAILGSDFTHNQRLILRNLGVKRVVLATDRDEPGMNAGDKIRQTLSREFNVIDVELPVKDVAELNNGQIRKLFEKLI